MGEGTKGWYGMNCHEYRMIGFGARYDGCMCMSRGHQGGNRQRERLLSRHCFQPTFGVEIHRNTGCCKRILLADPQTEAKLGLLRSDSEQFRHLCLVNWHVNIQTIDIIYWHGKIIGVVNRSSSCLSIMGREGKRSWLMLLDSIFSI